MKKVKFELETIVAPEDLLKNELANIRGGLQSSSVTCNTGNVKCKKDGNVNRSASLSVW